MPCELLWEALFQTISGNIQIRTSVDQLPGRRARKQWSILMPVSALASGYVTVVIGAGHAALALSCYLLLPTRGRRLDLRSPFGREKSQGICRAQNSRYWRKRATICQYAETSAEASRPEEVVHGREAIRPAMQFDRKTARPGSPVQSG